MLILCDNTHNYPPGASSYVKSMNKMEGMRLYLMREGYVGMGSMMLRAGDVVIMLIGASVSSAIRPLARAGRVSQFTLLGDVYCNGIMDGELIRGGILFEIINLV